MRKTMIGAITLTLIVMALSLMPAQAIPGEHGCVAPAGTSCTFTGLSGGTAPTGFISVTDASWTITHVVDSITVTDASGTGPGINSLAFAAGVTYTLTVDAGTGAVTAGTPE